MKYVIVSEHFNGNRSPAGSFAAGYGDCVFDETARVIVIETDRCPQTLLKEFKDRAIHKVRMFCVEEEISERGM
jgi:hypothetical protein